jgi:hypothetical protein
MPGQLLEAKVTEEHRFEDGCPSGKFSLSFEIPMKKWNSQTPGDFRPTEPQGWPDSAGL